MDVEEASWCIRREIRALWMMWDAGDSEFDDGWAWKQGLTLDCG
jgi:hypothetical protein